MPLSRGSQVLTRLLTAILLSVAILVVAVLLFAAGDGYRVQVRLDNASQLVKGNLVKVGGVEVGKVRSLELDDDGSALVELEISDGDLAPLHEGSRVEVRSTSLSGIANRYVALAPGPNSEKEIPDGGEIPGADAQSEVDLDEVLNTLHPDNLRDLQRAVQGLGTAATGRGRELNAAIAALNPALSQSAATSREVIRDERAFERFLVESAQVVGAVSQRRPDVERLVPATGSTLRAIASHTAELDDSLRRLPPTLRLTNTTLVNLRGLVTDLRPAVREARPAAPLLAEFLRRLQPVARRGTAVVPGLRRLIDTRGSRQDLIGVLGAMPGVEATARPALRSAVRTVDDALPVVKEIRPYVPDLLGAFRGFGGTTSSYYDANGRYTRISFQGSGFSLSQTGQLVPLQPNEGGLAGYRTHQNTRCPGAATQPHPDRSNPWRPSSVDWCDPEAGAVPGGDR